MYRRRYYGRRRGFRRPRHRINLRYVNPQYARFPAPVFSKKPLSKRRRYRRRGPTRSPVFTRDERLYIKALVNPFGATPFGTYHQFSGARIMDGVTQDTIALTCTDSFTFNVGTERAGLKLRWPLYNDDGIGIEINHSVAAAASPTAVDVSNDCPQWDNIQGNLTHVRLVGCAMKINAISSPEDTGGTMRAGLTFPAHRTAEAAWGRTWNTILGTFDDNIYSANDGITVRWVPFDNEDYKFHVLEAVAGNTYLQTHNHWMPTVYFDGGKANTVLQCSCVYHLEVVHYNDTTGVASPSPCSPKWNLIQGMVADIGLQPIVTRGNSFRSFFSSVGRAIGKVARWVTSHLPIVGSVSKFIGGVL